MVARGTFLILIVLLLIPHLVFAGIVEGRLAYRKGDYAKAKREFEADLRGGTVGAYFLALMYLRGEGVKKDEARGLALLKTSADDGYSAAQYLLGKCHLYGLGVTKSKTLATSYLLAAAADDDYRAVVMLRILKKGSRGEKNDQQQIVAATRRKARSKDPDAQYTLAFMHLVGDGVTKDGAQELRWYEAAAAKNSRAAFMLSLMYYYGDGVAQNTVKALRLMRGAAQKGDPRAQYYLGTFFYQGVGSPEDRPSAAIWFRISALAGYAEAQLAYGMVLLSGDGVDQDKGQAIEWLTKAAHQNNSRAKEVIGELLTYRGPPNASLIAAGTRSDVRSSSQQTENQLRLEGKGLILDQGLYGLKFSLPTLYDAYAPQSHIQSRTVWEKLQGGTFEIIFREPN